jgi:hypothetical protein
MRANCDRFARRPVQHLSRQVRPSKGTPIPTRASIAGLTALVCFVGVSAALAQAAARPFVVKSSLDKRTVLPHRIHWLAYPSLPHAQVKKVDYSIDGGPVRWTEHHYPYSFSDNGAYLVTTWLKPGRHRFTVRAVATDGRVAIDTVTAKTVAPPAVPAAQHGTWERAPFSKALPGWPTGTYKLIFDRRWIELIHPGPFDPVKSVPTGEGYINYFDWNPLGAGRFHAQGAVTLKEQGPKDRVGGWLCEPGGPGSNYTWSVTGTTLTLTPAGGSDACHLRGRVWAGEWTRSR